MVKKVAKETALATPVYVGLTLQEWGLALSVIYSLLLILRALGVPVNKIIPQLYRCAGCMVRYQRCSGVCRPMKGA